MRYLWPHSAANRVNPKFQRLLCEMARFGLMDEGVLLDYCERILRNENSQTTKEISSILEQLGTVIYYRSLPTHTRYSSPHPASTPSSPVSRASSGADSPSSAPSTSTTSAD